MSSTVEPEVVTIRFECHLDARLYPFLVVQALSRAMLSLRGVPDCVDEFTLHGRRLPVPAIRQA
ncbi:MAG TPA: hypothetical protein VGA68_01840, partial [Woeseiaceae bacterium]